MEKHDRQTELQRKQKEAEFFTEDSSLLAPFLKKLITQHVFNILPASYSANQLTLSGGACALLVPLSIWFASIEIEQQSITGRLILVVSAFLLIAYAVFDQLDGMQARKLGTSNSFGDFIDHWVDTTIANLATVPIMLMVGLDDRLILAMVLVVLLAFWASNWEIKQDNKRLLPQVGGLESIVVGMSILIATAIFGVGLWQVKIGGVAITWIIYAITFPWLIVVIAQVALRSRKAAWHLFADMALLLLTLGPTLVWLISFAPRSGESLIFNYGYISLGILSTLMTGSLMRHHWLGSKYLAFNPVYFTIGLVILVLEYLPISATSHTLAFGVLVLGLIVLLIHQGLDTYNKTNAT